MNKPQCRIDRGYDTHVQVYPKSVYADKSADSFKNETHRVVTVTCLIHNNTFSKCFPTKGKENIKEIQDIVFEQCFERVTKQCFLCQDIA